MAIVGGGGGRDLTATLVNKQQQTVSCPVTTGDQGGQSGHHIHAAQQYK